jgi:Flp pilus assembly pilin Flp
MRRILSQFWNDEAGCMSTEWAMLATILVLGAVTGAILSQGVAMVGEELPTFSSR